MGKKTKGGGKKRRRIHKHRYKQNKQQSPRKGRKALLSETAEETNTCPTTVENKVLPEPSCSRTTLEMDGAADALDANRIAQASVPQTLTKKEKEFLRKTQREFQNKNFYQIESVQKFVKIKWPKSVIETT